MLKIDIVSDVVCPWCIVGYKQLEQALERSDVTAQIHWHPFELNPTMPPEGQNLREHIVEKYGITHQQSLENRQRLTNVGKELGFEFDFSDDSRMVNTFMAHQLLHWAGLQSVEIEHTLKIALFTAHFSDGHDISDFEMLVEIATRVGLDTNNARGVLNEKSYERDVRVRQKLWTDRGISGVPAMVFNDKYLITGAQGVDNYVSVITQIVEESTLAV